MPTSIQFFLDSSHQNVEQFTPPAGFPMEMSKTWVLIPPPPTLFWAPKPNVVERNWLGGNCCWQFVGNRRANEKLKIIIAIIILDILIDGILMKDSFLNDLIIFHRFIGWNYSVYFGRNKCTN
jgi:hypothetical protein